MGKVKYDENTDKIHFSSGKVLDTPRGVIGLQPRILAVYGGSDQDIHTEYHRTKGWGCMEKDWDESGWDKGLTHDEIVELADFMIEKWEKLRELGK